MNTIVELRELAEKILEENPKEIDIDKWSGNFKQLLNELSIYQIELEHQNQELEKSEKLLAQSHEEFTKLFESTPVGYVILDENRNIVRVNQTFISSFVSVVLNEFHLESKSFDDFVIDEFKNAFILFCKMAQTKNVPIPIELKLRDRHNMSRYVLLTGKIYDAEQKTIAITASDLSMQKKMEDQLVKAKENEINANRQKSKFLSTVNQEMRTPLSMIIGYKEIINDPQLSDMEKIECCNELISTCEMLQNFSDRIFDISVLESGEIPLRCQDIDIKHFCNETLQPFVRLFKKKNASLVLHADNIPYIWIDPLRLNQIMNSILEHISENVNHGEVVITCLYLAENSKYGKLLINFSGEEIFSSEKSFDQQKNTRFGTISLDRLGMTIARQMLSTLNGQMNWEHPLNCLSIEIPITISSYREKSNNNINNADNVNSLSLNDSVVPEKKCLLVDDVMMNLKILAVMMKKSGFIPVLASSCIEALDLLKKEKIDIVLTDLWMPELTGEDLAIAIRQNSEFDNIPIFAVTADIEADINFDMSFFDGTIVKPIVFEKIQSVILKLNHPRNPR